MKWNPMGTEFPIEKVKAAYKKARSYDRAFFLCRGNACLCAHISLVISRRRREMIRFSNLEI